MSHPWNNVLAVQQAVLVDISGTLEVAGEEIPGSVAALARLRAAGIPVR